MKKEELEKILAKLPAGTEIYVRSRDDAWPAKARLFSSQGRPPDVLYLESAAGDHRNFPEGYSGVKELPLS